jgi:Spy/CpxP family protein refolding chaperone
MRRIYKIGLALVALAAVVVAGARAYAQRHGFFQAAISAHIDEALDAAKATPQQRAAIEAARDHVFAAFKDGHQNRAGELEEALSLFQADKLDEKAIVAHRDRREAEVKKIGDAIVQAVFDAHEALTAPQRKAVVDYVRAQHQSHQSKRGGFQEHFIQRMVDSRVEAALDEIKATPQQRATVERAKNNVLAVLKESHQDHGADFERMLNLFAADKLDASQLEAVRADGQARMRKIADTVVQALTDVHDALSAQQRKVLTDWVRAHHPHHG